MQPDFSLKGVLHAILVAFNWLGVSLNWRGVDFECSTYYYCQLESWISWTFDSSRRSMWRRDEHLICLLENDLKMSKSHANVVSFDENVSYYVFVDLNELLSERNNWRVRWKKGARIFTQNWTLSKTLQISHAVLFRCVKQCSVCFFAEVFFVYEILRMQKKPVFVVSSARDRKDGNFT